MMEIEISIKTPANDPVIGLACHDFTINGNDVIWVVEHPRGKYRISYQRSDILYYFKAKTTILQKVSQYLRGLYQNIADKFNYSKNYARSN